MVGVVLCAAGAVHAQTGNQRGKVSAAELQQQVEERTLVTFSLESDY